MIDARSKLPQLDLPLSNPIKRPVLPRYALEVNGNTYTWSGRGRVPHWFYEAQRHAPQAQRHLTIREFVELHAIKGDAA